MNRKTAGKKAPAKKKATSPSGKALANRSTKSRGTAAGGRSEKPRSVIGYPRKEIVRIALIFTTVVLALSYYFNSFGLVGKILKLLGFILIGAGAYAIPVMVLIATVHIFFTGTLAPHRHRYVFASLGIICVSALHTLYYYVENPSLFNGGVIETIYYSSIGCESGGFIGALLSLPFCALVSPTGICVILVCLALVCFVTATGTQPLTNLARFVASKISDFAKEIDSERRAAQEHVSDDGEVKINGEFSQSEKPDKKEHRKKKSDSEKNAAPKQGEAAQSDEAPDFKINLYDKKQEVQPTVSADIPEDIQNAATEASGGVSEDKPDTTPIEVTDEEIDTDYIDYTFPPIDLLKKGKAFSGGGERPEDLRTQAKKLVETLHSFGVEAKVLEVSKGPSVTRFELQPSAGVKVSKIVNLADDIALNLAAFGVRIEAPIPGKAAVGIEIPNKTTSTVCLRDVIDSREFQNFKSKTAFAMGKDISGQAVVSDISKMPHMLIAGATGSGKSVCINSLITSILYKADPNQVKLILIDPKVVELGVYNGIPHLLIPVVTDPRRAAGALNWAVQEMVKRYRTFADNNVRDIKGYNEYAALSGEREMEQIIIIIDELADLMMVSPHEVEDSICRLAQMARAAGMHLVIATQRPSVDVITGLIKANVPSRIAFSVSSQIDSRTILDMGGAEKLLGKGDMLFLPMGASKPKRIQGAFVSDKEVERIVEFVKEGLDVHYNEDIIEHIENGAEADAPPSDDSEADEFLPQAIEIVVETGQASVSLLQRKLKVGYARAGRLVDQLEERGIIGPHEGSKPRKVLMSRAEFQEMMANPPEND